METLVFEKTNLASTIEDHGEDVEKSTGLVHVGFNSYSVVFEDYRSIITYGDDAVEIGVPLVAVAYTW